MPTHLRSRTLRRLTATLTLALLLLAATTGPAGPAGAEAEGEGPLPEQPDVLISKNGTTFIGDGIYNTTGAGQSLSRTAALGTTVRFYLRTQNDGDDLGSTATLKGCASNASFRVRYFGQPPGPVPPMDVTGVFSGGGGVPHPGGSEGQLWWAEVRVKTGAPAGATLTCKVRMTDTVDQALRDVAVFTVQRR